MATRRCFLAAAAAATLNSSRRAEANDNPGLPKVVPANSGRKVWVFGVLVTLKITAPETASAYSVFEDYIPPGAGPIPHTHTREDETLYVLEGTLRAWLGGVARDLKAGDFVHMPRGVEHAFKNLSDTPTRLLLSYTPGGFERWFLEVGKPFVEGTMTPPKASGEEIEQAVRAATDYGVTFQSPRR